MDESLSRWLALRQEADFAARSKSLTARIADYLRSTSTTRVLDLATGTGSNIRYLHPHLGAQQEWLAVDKDAALLGEVETRTRAAGFTGMLEPRSLDLGSLHHDEIFANRHLVTASALLDLVSEGWIRWVVAGCCRGRAAALFTISYNGYSVCMPAEPEDDEVLRLFNAHQGRDKGLGGPALGPRAADVAADIFHETGFEVWTERSDWILSSAQTEIQRYLIDGWAFAATEVDPTKNEVIGDWRARRLDHIERGRSEIVVGHLDLAAIPR